MLSDAQLARICYMLQYEVHLALGDPLPHWDDTGEDQHHVWIDTVRMLLIGSTPAQVHDHWCEGMTGRGWTYGPERDQARQTHPMIRPLHELTLLEQAKEKIAQATIAMLIFNLPPEVADAAGSLAK